MKLGSKLKKTLVTLEQAGITPAEAQSGVNAEMVAKERKKIEAFIEMATDHIVQRIENDQVPHIVVEEKSIYPWLKSACEGNARFQDLWTGFVKMFYDEGLDIVVKLEYNDDRTDFTVIIGVTVRPEALDETESSFR